jgi:hypothetical protein
MLDIIHSRKPIILAWGLLSEASLWARLGTSLFAPCLSWQHPTMITPWIEPASSDSEEAVDHLVTARQRKAMREGYVQALAAIDVLVDFTATAAAGNAACPRADRKKVGRPPYCAGAQHAGQHGRARGAQQGREVRPTGRCGSSANWLTALPSGASRGRQPRPGLSSATARSTTRSLRGWSNAQAPRKPP